MKSKNGIIVIGLPMFKDVSPENKVDFGRMMFTFGRRFQDWNFMISWRAKAEQFRARNFIVDKAREIGAKYLLFLDDDQIFDYIGEVGSRPFMFLDTFLQHMEENEDLGIVGALYFQRGGGLYKPVLMHDAGDDAAIFYDDHEIENKFQFVDIQGGGVMFIRMDVFDKMKEPYFKPETLEGADSRGTDLQICRKVRDLGWKVACDTSIVVGHEHSDRFVVSPQNRHILMENAHSRGTENIIMELNNWTKMVLGDLKEYTGKSAEYIESCGDGKYYEERHRKRFGNFENPKEYYLSIGDDAIFRQFVYNSTPRVQVRNASIINMLRSPKELTVLDYGCGISLVGFEALRLGHYVDFIDIEGTAVLNFLKWRVEKYDKTEKASFSLGGPYDVVIMNDIIEHLEDWEYHLDNIIGRMNPGAALITNFFTEVLRADDPEHLHLDREGVSNYLLERGFMPSHMGLWIKRDNFMGGPKNVRNLREDVHHGQSDSVG